jgi:hypothetical protein
MRAFAVSLVATVFVSFVWTSPCFAQGKGDATLNIRIADTSMEPEAKAALAKILQGEDKTIADLIALSRESIVPLSTRSRVNIRLFLQKQKLEFGMLPFEIEEYRVTGVVPKPSLGSRLERSTLPKRYALLLGKEGVHTIEDLRNLSADRIERHKFLDLNLRAKRALRPILERAEHAQNQEQQRREREKDQSARLEKLKLRQQTRQEKQTRAERRASALKLSQRIARPAIAESPEEYTDLTLSNPTLEVLQAHGISDASQLKGKSQRWLASIFPEDGPDARWNILRRQEVTRFITSKFGVPYFDDLESAIDRQDLKASIDPILMNLPAELLAELGKVETVQDLITRTQALKADTTKIPSAVFKSFCFRLKIYLERCEFKLARPPKTFDESSKE